MKDTPLTSPEFSRLVSGFEKELIKADKADVNINEHTNHITEFLHFAEENAVNSIQAIQQPVIDKYISYLEKERMNLRIGGNLSEPTINKHKCTIRKFWKYLHAEGIKARPIRAVQKKKTQQAERTVLTHQEIEQLYSVCDNSAIGYRDRAMLAVYYGCGLRKSEGLNLLLTDFDFGRGKLHVRKSKTGRERFVMMAPKVQQQIEEYVYSWRDFYLSEQSTYQNLFIGERGNPIHGETLACRIEDLWQRVKDRYGSDKHIGCHTLRHSLGTHLYILGMKIELIAMMLGHVTLEATQLYIHSANSLKK